MNKSVLVNIAISIAMFIYIFYYFLGKSGGDMAIMAMNVIFGFFQILIIAVFPNKNNGIMKYKIIFAVILVQIIELTVFLKFGYSLNEYFKK